MGVFLPTGLSALCPGCCFSVSEFNSDGVVLNFGGNFNDQNPDYGLFYLNGDNRASNANRNVGARQLVFRIMFAYGGLYFAIKEVN